MIRKLRTALKHLLSAKYRYLHHFDIKKGDVVIDLGANVGEVSEYFLSKGAHVYAYEPNPYAFDVLTQRLSANDNIKIFQKAVSDAKGKSHLYLHQEHAASEVTYAQGSSLEQDKENVCQDSIEVEVEDIKEILKAFDHIALLKIDIEGGEYRIIDDILENISKIDFVLLELHANKNPAFKDKEEDLLRKISQSSYKKKFYTDWF